MTGNCLVLVKAVMMVLMKELMRDSLWVPLMGVESVRSLFLGLVSLLEAVSGI